MSHVEHRSTAPISTRCCILTISDTRTEETDISGRLIFDLLTANGHDVIARQIIPDEPDQVRVAVQNQLINPALQVIITTGGTGISSRDNSFEVIDALLQKRLVGFGELFRLLSYEKIGSAALLSRACAGTFDDKVILSLPGSERAVHLAMTKLILPELGHLVREASR